MEVKYVIRWVGLEPMHVKRAPGQTFAKLCMILKDAMNEIAHHSDTLKPFQRNVTVTIETKNASVGCFSYGKIQNPEMSFRWN